MASHFPMSPEAFGSANTGSSEQMVKAALSLLCAYHEAELDKLQAIRDGEKPRSLHNMIDTYHQFLERTEDSEDAFIAFLQHLSE